MVSFQGAGGAYWTLRILSTIEVLLEALDERQGLADDLVRELNLLAVGTSSQENQDDSSERGDVAGA